MVKQTLIYFGYAAFLLMPHYSMADTYQQYQQAVDSGQSKIDQSKQLLRYDQLDKYIQSPMPAAKPNNSVKPDVKGVNPSAQRKSTPTGSSTNTSHVSSQQTSKPSQPSKTKAGSHSGQKGKNLKRATRRVEQRRRISHSHDAGFYIAPSLSSGGGSEALSNNTPDIQLPKTRNIIFGIRIGTEIPVKLVGGASNVQPGYMKFRVTQAITGDKRTLPANSYLFARPSAVLGSPRIYVRGPMTGITPGGKEFTIRATIEGSDKQPGLLAYVVNDGKSLYRAADAGKTALGEGLISLAGQGVVQDAAKASAGQLLSEQRKEAKAKYGQDAYVVESNPQHATIQIEETF